MPQPFPPGTIAKVITDYHVAYPDALVARAGEQLKLGRVDTQWPYIWCSNPSGKSGWVPVDYLEQAGETGRLRYDYSAHELEARVGDVITLEKFVGGWYWASNRHGQRGWIPAENVASAAAPNAT